MPKTRRILNIVQLEDRATPAVFTVTTAADNTAGSFREALVSTNSTPGIDTINFAIPGSGVQTLALSAALPAITEGVTINGSSQPGFANSPLIHIDGTGLPTGTNGLTLSNHTSSTIKALAIGGFSTGAGIRIDGGGLNIVANNFIGTNAAGTAAQPNSVGIIIAASKGNFISNTTDTRNVISGNLNGGVLITDGSSLNTVAANYIGVGNNGVTALGNGGFGVALTNGAVSNTIGGTVAGAGDVIAANKGPGILLSDPTTAGNLIQGNRIGLDFSGSPSANLGDGIRVANAVGTASSAGIIFQFPDIITTIRSNSIQQNSQTGVAVVGGSQHVRIVENSIANNGSVGISVDSASNDALAPPVLTKLVTISSGVTINGTLVGRANTKYDVTVYGISTADASGFGEGETKVSTVTITTDARGNGTFAATVVPSLSAPFFSATASHANTGDTSGFSLAKARTAQVLDSRLAAASAGTGGLPVVSLYDSAGTLVNSYQVFDNSFTGGVRTAIADFNADGVPDLLVGTGPGAATRVRVIDGQTRAMLFDLQPFEASFTGGVYVSAGDVTGDGIPEAIVSPDEGGGPRVTVFSGKGFGVVADFFGISDTNFRGGARTAVGDVNNDGTGDLVVAAGFGGGPRVAVFNGRTVPSGAPTTLFNDFFVFEQTLRNGVFIAAGDIDGDGFAEVIAGGGPGGGPRVFALSGKMLLSNQSITAANFFAGDPANRGGVRVAARDLNADGATELLAGDGPGAGGRLRVYAATDLSATATPNPRLDLAAFPEAAGGIFVG